MTFEKVTLRFGETLINIFHNFLTCLFVAAPTGGFTNSHCLFCTASVEISKANQPHNVTGYGVA